MELYCMHHCRQLIEWISRVVLSQGFTSVPTFYYLYSHYLFYSIHLLLTIISVRIIIFKPSLLLLQNSDYHLNKFF